MDEHDNGPYDNGPFDAELFGRDAEGRPVNRWGRYEGQGLDEKSDELDKKSDGIDVI